MMPFKDSWYTWKDCEEEEEYISLIISETEEEIGS